MDLTVQQLRYFVAVADELHFARAAQGLRISAPSLSQQIAALERKFGAPLFRRDARHVELTEPGAELLPMARRSIAALDDIVSWAEERRAGGAVVRVGLVVGSHIGSAILAEAARASRHAMEDPAPRVRRFPDRAAHRSGRRGPGAGPGSSLGPGPARGAALVRGPGPGGRHRSPAGRP
ncbi:LysR family transcriptional regulator [Streptomyces sp. NPDC005780]|uniref:LysR family transcriptional regulator n=1 Tax=Streptomyces sp. NPDC005780 TaxID=3364730 RepID=UPI00368BDC90